MLTIPLAVLLFLILLFPFILEIFLSTTSWQPTFGPAWWSAPFVGYKNYVTLLTTDSRFIMSVARTALLVAVGVGSEFAIGLGLASLFAKEFQGKKAFFLMLLSPMFVMPIVVGYVFYMLFLERGPVNFIIGSIIRNPGFTFAWTSDPTFSFVAILLTDIWHWTPLMFLILLAGMTSLPEEPIRAAKVLGASNWQIFWHVKIGMLRPIIAIAVILRAMELMKFFDEVFIMTGGGPGTSTETISIYTYLSAVMYTRIGYTSAAAIIILIISVVLITYAARPILRRAR